MGALKVRSSVVTTLGGNNNWGSSGVVVWVVGVGTLPVLEVGDLVVDNSSRNGVNSLTDSEKVVDGTEVQVVSTIRSRKNSSVGVVVEDISLGTNEKVTNTSTFMQRVERTKSSVTLSNLDGNWGGGNNSGGSESRGSEGKLHCKSECESNDEDK